jgi:hypothetical protein
MNTIQFLKVLAERDAASVKFSAACADGNAARVAAAEAAYNAAVANVAAANVAAAGDLDVVVGLAIAESQNENRVVEICDFAGLAEALALECGDNCDGDGGNYWGENEHGAWRICVLEVES